MEPSYVGCYGLGFNARIFRAILTRTEAALFGERIRPNEISRFELLNRGGDAPSQKRGLCAYAAGTGDGGVASTLCDEASQPHGFMGRGDTFARNGYDFV